MKYFHVQFYTYEKRQWEHPFVNRCEGIVSSEIDEFGTTDIRQLFDYACRFAFIECQEMDDPDRIEKHMNFLKSRLGRFSEEKEVRFKMVGLPIGGVDAVIDSNGPRSVKIIFDILPCGADPLSLSVQPSAR